MTTITTVRAALKVMASQGMSSRTMFGLGAAMGPATLYVAGFDTPAGFEPIRRTDSVGRKWLLAFTVPHQRSLAVTPGSQLRYSEVTGAALLRLAIGSGSSLVLEPRSPLECRIPIGAANSLQVAADYTETMATGVAAVPPASLHQASTPPIQSRERLAS